MGHASSARRAARPGGWDLKRPAPLWPKNRGRVASVRTYTQSPPRNPERNAPMSQLQIPAHLDWRTYQAELVHALRPREYGGRGMKRAAVVWHRRAGKDVTTLNWTIEAMLQRAGSYNYFFPTFKLGKR